jgi:hypothetical protein
MTVNSPWIGAVASWLLEFYGLSTIVLVSAGLIILVLKQPAYRLSVARAALLTLAMLGPMVANVRFARGSTIADPPPSDLCSPPTWSSVAPADPWPTAIVGIFGVGSGLALGWLVLGAVASSKLLRRSRPAPSPILAILAKVAGQGGGTPRLLNCN